MHDERSTARCRVRTNEPQLILQFVRVFANNLGDRDARMNHRDAPFSVLTAYRYRTAVN